MGKCGRYVNAQVFSFMTGGPWGQITFRGPLNTHWKKLCGGGPQNLPFHSPTHLIKNGIALSGMQQHARWIFAKTIVEKNHIATKA